MVESREDSNAGPRPQSREAVASPSLPDVQTRGEADPSLFTAASELSLSVHSDGRNVMRAPDIQSTPWSDDTH
jgi:hypothetical protein